MNEDTSDALCQITHYDQNSITVSGTVYCQAIVVFPDRVIAEWRPQSLQEISDNDLEPILSVEPEILIIGVGARPLRLSPYLRQLLENHNIGVETMTTAAACRSYMALLSEGRRMAAILFPGA